MNILHVFTRRSLAENRSRTLVTIVGIVLSMALFTAVIEGAYSGQQFLIRSEIAQNGSWVLYYPNVTDAQAKELLADNGVLNHTDWRQIGWADIGSQNVNKPYLLIKSIEKNFTDLVAVNVTSGRMPEREGEILLPNHLASNGGVKYALSDVLTLAVGRRTADGEEIGEAYSYVIGRSEEIVDTILAAYTVVGFYDRFDSLLESNDCAGYTALTIDGNAENIKNAEKVGSAGNDVSAENARGAENAGITEKVEIAENVRSAENAGTRGVFLTLKRMGDVDAVNAENVRGAENVGNTENAGTRGVFLTLKHMGDIDAFEVRHNEVRQQIDYKRHKDLITVSGELGDSAIANMLYGFAGILVFLVSFGSISLIYNSFAISVSERTRQFGILKSVGATKKQIRRSVLYEALVLGGIGIPLGMAIGCAGIGLTLYLLRDAFRAFVNLGSETGVQIRLVLHPLALFASAAVCLLTTLVSAWIPASRAMRVPAIDAIRQTADVKISARKVKTSRLTEKLFGFEGVMASKNFKRNRKRYRSTVVSLFLSVTLFISSSSLCTYLTDAVETAGGREESPDIVYDSVGEDRPNPDELLEKLISVNGVEEGGYYEDRMMDFRVDPAEFDASMLDLMARQGETVEAGEVFTITCVFLEDNAFRKMCAANDLDAAPYFDRTQPTALVQNEVSGRIFDESGNYRWVRWKYFDGARFPITLPVNGVDIGGENDTVLSAPIQKLTLGAPLKTGYMGITENCLAFYFPFSMKDAILPEAVKPYDTIFCFRAPKHAQAATEMTKLLSDMELPAYRLKDHAADKDMMRMMVRVVNVFAYGFIILISLIAAANVFNTISTSISLRRREFAMLKSVGLGEKGFMRMMNYECIIYGVKGLLLGLPVSILMTYGIWRVGTIGVESDFYIPWYSVVVAVGSVFAVVFVTMLYAAGKIKKDNPIDALKNENL